MKLLMGVLVLLLLAVPVTALQITSAQSWIENGELQTFVTVNNPEEEDISVSVYVLNDGWYLKRTVHSDDSTASAFLIDQYDGYGEDLWVRIRVRDDEGNAKTVYRPVFR